MLGIKEIQEIIPHRHPFLLVDCVEELEPGVRAVGYKSVTYNEPYFAGHFPQEPVMPGVLIVEALAQTGAVAILSVEDPGTISICSAKIPSGGTAMFALLAMAGDMGGALGPAVVGNISQNAGDNIQKGMFAGCVFPLVLIISVLFVKKLSRLNRA